MLTWNFGSSSVIVLDIFTSENLVHHVLSQDEKCEMVLPGFQDLVDIYYTAFLKVTAKCDNLVHLYVYEI